MKRCLIGLATPIGYHSGYEPERNRPNPILEAPMGLFLFYDEIWFIHRRVCPYNMQDLDYVHFVDEEYDPAFLSDLHWRLDSLLSSIDMGDNDQRMRLVGQNSPVTRGVKSHGKRLSFGGREEIRPSCVSGANHMFDRVVADVLSFELVTNSVFTSSVQPHLERLDDVILSSRLVFPEFPNYQGIDGPYLKVIEDFRCDSALKAFRRRIGDVDTSSFSSVQEAIDALDVEIRRAGEGLIKEAASPVRIYKGVCSAIVGQIPILSSIYGALETVHGLLAALRERKKLEWMAFVARGRDVPANTSKRKRRKAQDQPQQMA